MAAKRLSKAYIFLVAMIFSALTFCHVQASVFSAQSVVDLANKDRTAKDIPVLKINDKLSKAAEEKAYDMFANNYFAHTSPDGVTPWQWIEKSGYDYAFAGENLAINFIDAQSQHTALMNSESHRKNILNGKYQDIGVAVVEGTMDGRKTIITVQEFGALVGAVPSSKTAPTVEGAAAGKENYAPMAPVNDGFGKIKDFTDGVVGSVTRDIDSALSSHVGGTYTYSMITALAMIFCLLVFLVGHAHGLAHQFSSWRERTKRIFSNVDEKYPDHSLANFVDSVHLGKIYLTHMKMRK